MGDPTPTIRRAYGGGGRFCTTTPFPSSSSASMPPFGRRVQGNYCTSPPGGGLYIRVICG